MSQSLPLYLNLVYGGGLVLIFTGSWALLNDLALLLADENKDEDKPQIQTTLLKLRVRRVMALFAGIGMIIFYFLEKNLVGFTALIFGAFWLDSMNLIARTRRFVSSIEGK